MARAPKMNPMTQAVLGARQKYVENLEAISSSPFAQIPYMKERIDPRTRDKQLAMLTPQDLAQMAQTDPKGAEAAAYRINQIQEKTDSAPRAPYEAQYEGDS